MSIESSQNQAHLPARGIFNKRREFLRVLLTQIYFTFVDAIPLLALLGSVTGLALAFQARIGLSFIGGNDSLGQIIVYVLFREAAPLISSIILITRSVTAVASELATMKVGREIEALTVMGINISEYLLAPRLLAGNISLFLMTITFTYFSMIGAWIGANFTSYFPVTAFISSIMNSMAATDFLFFFLKTNLIGYAVMKIACLRGLSLSSGAFEVPIVTNRAVVDCLFAAFFLQGMVSGLFYMLVGIKL